MSKEELMQAAVQMGFLNASKIIPAHMIGSSSDPVLVIPEDAELFIDGNGNMCFRVLPNTTAFPAEHDNYKWEGIVYYKLRGQWATIVESRKVDLTGRYLRVLNPALGGRTDLYGRDSYLKILSGSGAGCYNVEHCGTLHLEGKANRIERGYVQLMPLVWEIPPDPPVLQELSNFPSEGVCWQPTQALRDYLLARNNSSTTACGYHVKGIAWNYNSCWEVAISSGKPLYNIKQLEPFFVKKEQVPFSIRNGYRLPDKWSIKVTEENRGSLNDFLKSEKHRYDGHVAGWSLTTGFWFCYPQCAPNCHSSTSNKVEDGYTEITFEEFQRHVSRQIPTHVGQNPMTPEECFFPEKWCIRVDTENNVEVSAFLFREKDKFEGFANTWCPLANRFYFHYPQWEPGIRQASTVKKGYTEITFEQFKKHVLTHTDKKQIINENQLNQNQDGRSRESRESSDESNKGESCKVQRPYLSVRGGSEIRATSIRCSKVQIKVGNGYSSDSL